MQDTEMTTALPEDDVSAEPEIPDVAEEEGVPEEIGEDGADEMPPRTDYERLAEEDMREIHRIAPIFASIREVGDLPNATRYATLRDAGLTVEEALWATCHAFLPKNGYDNRSHLRSGVPRGAAGNPIQMSAEELAAAKDLFSDMSEAEIRRLYAKCRA